MARLLASASSQRLELTTPPNHNGPLTIAFFFKATSLPGSSAHILNLQSSTHDYGDMDSLVLMSDGTLKIESIVNYSAASSTGATVLSVGTWYFLALVRESSTLLRLRIQAVSETTVTQDVSTRLATSYMNLGAYYDSGAFAHIDGAFEGMRCWEAALTQTELQAEMRQLAPVRTADLFEAWDFWPNLPSSGDYNGYDWTEYGSPTNADGTTRMRVATAGLLIGQGRIGYAIVGDGTPETVVPNANGTSSQVAGASASAAGNVAIAGTAAQLGAASGSAAGAVAITGTGSAVAGASLAAAGSPGITGASSSAAGASLAAQATVGTPGAASGLGSSSATAAATVAIGGTAGASSGASLTANGTIAVAGTVAQVLGAAVSLAAVVAIGGTASHELRLTSAAFGLAAATVTSVVVRQSGYSIGIRHLAFDGSGSTAASGPFWRKAWLQWHVVQGGVVISSHYGTPNFSYLCTVDGTTIYYRAIDDEGNAGEWGSTTISLSPLSAADYAQVIDTAAGLDTNSGTSQAAPVATLSKAIEHALANWIEGGTHVIYVKYGQTPSGVVWAGHTVRGRIVFAPWGNPVDGPAAVTNTSGDVLSGTGQTSVVFLDVDLDLGDGTIRPDSGIASRTVPYDWIFRGCAITRPSGLLSNIIDGHGEATRSEATRDAHGYGFFALEDVTMSSPTSGFGIYGLMYSTEGHLVNVTIGPLRSDYTSHPLRLFSPSDWHMRDCVFDAQAPTGGNIRFQTLPGLGSATRRITMQNCQVIAGTIYAHEGAADATFFARDITIVGCSSAFRFVPNVGGYSGSSFDGDRIIARNCGAGGEQEIPLHATEGSIGEMAWTNCHFVRDWHSGAIFQLRGAASRYGKLYFRNNVFNWQLSGNADAQTVFYAGSMSTAELAGIIDSDYNVAVTADADPINWAAGVALAGWQAQSQDLHSNQATSTTLPIAALPSSTVAFDPRLTSSGGYLAGKGFDGALIDIDGRVRVGGYAGPHDPEATSFPAGPPLDPTGTASGLCSASATAAGNVAVSGGGAMQAGASATAVGGVSLTGTGAGLTGASLTAAGVVSDPGAILGAASGESGASLTAVGIVSIAGQASATAGMSSGVGGAVGITGAADGLAGGATIEAYGIEGVALLGELVSLCGASLVATGMVNDAPSPPSGGGGGVWGPGRRQRFGDRSQTMGRREVKNWPRWKFGRG